jgi:type III pantothenate kinase
MARRHSSLSAVHFLVMDVSNSYTKWAEAHDSGLGPIHRQPTATITTAWVQQWHKKFPHHELVLGSVVPACTQRLLRGWKQTIRVVSGTSALPIGIDYPNPAQIGADRLANAVAAHHRFGPSTVVIDFGTAVTFDIINRRGAYAGGVIAPGLNAMTDYLHEKTALLPRITVQEPIRVIAQSTVEAMRVGAVVGYRGLVREILTAIRHELGNPRKLHVVATGGQAEIVARGLKEIQAVDQELTLEGLRLIGQHQSVLVEESSKRVK